MNISTKLLSLAAAALVASSASAQVASMRSDMTPRQVKNQPTAVVNCSQVAKRANIDMQSMTVNKVQQSAMSRANAWEDVTKEGQWHSIVNNLYSKLPLVCNQVTLQTRATDDADVTEYRVLNPFGYINEDKTPADDVFSPIFQETTIEGVSVLTVPAMESMLSYKETPVMYADMYGWYQYCWENGNLLGWKDEAAYQTDLAKALGTSFFDEEQGRYIINAVYFLSATSPSDAGYYMTMGDEYYQLPGNYSNFDFSIAAPYFYNEGGEGYALAEVNLNDNREARFYLTQGDLSKDNQTSNEIIQSIFKDEGVYSYTSVTKSELAKIQSADGEIVAGPYTLITVVIKPSGAGQAYLDVYQAAGTPEDWVFEGMGSYTDGLVKYALGGFDEFYPQGYTVEVPFEKAKDGKEVYRLVNPFATMGDRYSSYYSNVTYEPTEDYMTVHAEKADEIYIDNGTTGMAMVDDNGTAIPVNYQCDVYECIVNSSNIDPAMYGTNVDGIITFPLPDPEATFAPLYIEMNNESYMANMEGEFKIILPSRYVGINDVVSYSNAPVRYYNLQGQRVENPAQGSCYIRVQGNQAVKVVR